MSLTYLDSLMIENPAFFRELSAQRLSADLANFGSLSADFGKFKKIEIDEGAGDLAGRYYVATNGNDANAGTSPWAPLRTIKEACKRTHQALIAAGGNYSRTASTTKYTIFVSTGDYFEENPIYVPPNTSIIGDNLRRVSVFPVHRMYDLFWCENSVYIWGFTFRGHNIPAAAAAFPNLRNRTLSSIGMRGLTTPTYTGVTEWRRPYIVTSPYVQGCSSITRMLRPGRFQTAQSQSLTSANVSLINNLTGFNTNLDYAFDIITSTMINNGLTANRPFISNTVKTVDWVRHLGFNETFIQKETTGYVDAQYGANFLTAPQKEKCERDIGFILSAIETDFANGNWNQTLSAAREYFRGGIQQVPDAQVAPTINAMEFVKYLVKEITLAPSVTADPLWTGCGIRVDGALAEGFLRSFVMDSFTQFNEGGKGIHIINNGYAQLVSIFTICCTEGIHAESGGQCSINTSNCSFGLSGIVANGKSPVPVLSGILEDIQSSVVTFNNVRGIVITPDSRYVSEGNAVGVDTRMITTTPYNGMIFRVNNDPEGIDKYYVVRQDVVRLGNNRFQFAITERPTDAKRLALVPAAAGGINPDPKCFFFLRSLVTTSSHTMEYIGSGVLLEKAVPGLGGIANTENESIAGDFGAVYFTSTNQAGNFRVGTGFTILQETGIIEGDTFKRAILALVTPLVLSLE